MRLRNKHDNIPEWDIKRIEDRLDFLRQQLAAGDRLDGWTLQGHKDEVCKLLNEYHDIIDKEMVEDSNGIINEFEKFCLDNGIDPYLQTR
tara:strand:- start:32648 stop:32917 length:270 start_codon:yes stop_codon:yes gene_type:complete